LKEIGDLEREGSWPRGRNMGCRIKFTGWGQSSLYHHVRGFRLYYIN